MNILFLCVANSARSQMAEAMARVMAPKTVTVQSAGSHPTTVNPYAVRALAEVGIDVANARSRSVDEVAPDSVDLVVTLCAEEVCPAALLTHAQHQHWPIEDPAGHGGDEEEQLARFRAARELIRAELRTFFRRMEDSPPAP